MVASKAPIYRNIEVDLQGKGHWKIGQLLSAVGVQHPDCRLWAVGGKLSTYPEYQMVTTDEVMETSEGFSMMSTKYASFAL